MSLDIQNHCITVILLSKFACLVGCLKTVLRTIELGELLVILIPKCGSHREQVIVLEHDELDASLRADKLRNWRYSNLLNMEFCKLIIRPVVHYFDS